MLNDLFKINKILRYGQILLVLFSLEGGAYAQSSVEIKGAFIYNFIKSSQWSDFEGPFQVALLGKDNDLFRELATSLQGRPVQDRTLQIVNLTNVDEARSAQVLVLGISENARIQSITQSISGSETLLITDGNNNASAIMLNIVTSDLGRIGFEVNLANILAENLGISDDILSVGGADLEVVEVYNQMGTTLEIQKKTMASQNEELGRIQTEVNQQKSMIEEQKLRLTQQTEQLANQIQQLEQQKVRIEEQSSKINDREEFLSELEKQLEDGRVELEENRIIALRAEEALDSKLDTLIFREDQVEDLEDQIRLNSVELDRQNQEIADLAVESEQQKMNLVTQDTTIQQQETALITGIVIVILLLILSGVIARSYQINKRQSAALEKAKKLAEEANRTLIKQNEEIQENEKRFRMLFDSAYDTILIIKDEKIVDCNKNALEMFDCKREQILGVSPDKYSPARQPNGKDSKKKAAEFMKTALSGKSLFFEWVHIRHDGTPFEAEVSLNSIQVSGESYIQAFVRDITERKKAEEEISKLSTATEQSPATVVITNMDGTIEYVNPKFTEVTGYTAEETIGKNPRVLKSDNHTKDFYKNLWDTITSGKVWQGEFRNAKKNGELYWESSSISPIRNDEGEITHFIAVKEDITEKKKAEEELKKAKDELITVNESLEQKVAERTMEIEKANSLLNSQLSEIQEAQVALKEGEARYKALITTSNTGAWEFHGDSGFLWCSEEYFSMLGRSREDFDLSGTKNIDETWVELLHPEDQDRSSKSFGDYLEGGSVGMYDNYFRMKHTEGHWVWIWSRGSTLRDEDGNLTTKTVGTHIDITEQKQSEIELEKHRDHLEDLVKERTSDLEKARQEAEDANNAKSVFLANMSHDIRTPMNAVLGFSEILHTLITDEQQLDYLSSIRSSGKSLLGLINDILDLSKVEAGKLDLQYTAVNVHSVISDMKQMFSQKVDEKGIDFIIESSMDIPKAIILDEVRIRQILINLLGNSVKFTDTGHVKIVANCEFNPDNTSQLDLMISVQDTGIGIPDDQKDKVFEAFEQTKGQSTAKFGGTGLGLAITKKLITMMNGDVYVTGELGEGSQFNVTLRDIAVASVSDIEDLEEDKIDINSIEFEDGSILVVDDIESNRKLLNGFLKPFNFTIYEAENGEELLELARKHKPDLILTDMKMPVMDGYEATKILKDDPEIQHIPVVTITASVMMENEAKVKDVCDGYLKKPVSMNEIMIELTKYLKHTVLESSQLESNVEGSEDISGELESGSPENLSEVLAKLKSDFEPLWSELKETLTINEIEDFAIDIKEFGRQYKYGKIINWGAQLEKQAGNFEIDAMTITLEEFPDIIRDIESKI